MTSNKNMLSETSLIQYVITQCDNLCERCRVLEKGLIEQERISVPNGSITVLKLTWDGRDLLASWGIEAKPLPKNPSLKHEYYKELAALEYRSKG
jgi:hypothetical protein